MKGPMPEADAKITSMANSIRTAIIGISHHSFRSHRNTINSPTTVKFDVILRKNAFMDSSLYFRYSGDATTANSGSQPKPELLLPYDEPVYVQGVDVAFAECV